MLAEIWNLEPVLACDSASQTVALVPGYDRPYRAPSSAVSEMKRETHVFLCAIVGLAWVGMAQAEGVGAPRSGPLTVDVRPSRIDARTREQQERVIRRDRQLDSAFRSICTGCGTDVDH